MTDSTPTIALVRLVERKETYSWVVVRCPYCMKKHTHGGGFLAGNPRKLLGSRLSHCMDNRQMYELREVRG